MKQHLSPFSVFFQIILLSSLWISIPASFADSQQAALPVPYLAQYKAKIRGISINLEEQLKALSDNQFEITVQAKTFYASFNQRSLFEFENGIPDPVIFDSAQKIFGSARNYQIKFEDKSAHYKKGDTRIELEVPAGIQDILSVKLVLRHWLAQRDSQNEIEIPVVSKKKLKQYKFVVVGEQVIKTPAGRFNAIEVERIKAGKKLATFWFAKDWSYMLVKMEADDDGKSESMKLSSGVVDGRTMVGR